jgi:HK97 family phage prohead protease
MKHLEAQIRKLEDNTLEFVLSSEIVDRHRTVLRADGWDLSAFNENPVMPYQHSTNSTDPNDFLGTWSNMRIEDGKLIGTPEFEPKELNEKADLVKRKIEHGTFKTASVGFIPHEAHWGDKKRNEDPDVLYFDRMELLEVSIVGIPSNKEAKKRNFEELIRDFPKPKEDEEIQDKGRPLYEARLSLLTLNSNQ